MDLLWICFKQKKVSKLKPLVRGEGLEPSRDYSHRILSPTWLPLQHPRVNDTNIVEII